MIFKNLIRWSKKFRLFGMVISVRISNPTDDRWDLEEIFEALKKSPSGTRVILETECGKSEVIKTIIPLADRVKIDGVIQNTRMISSKWDGEPVESDIVELTTKIPQVGSIDRSKNAELYREDLDERHFKK